MPVVTAFYEANRTGGAIPRLKGTIDLIFAREPVSGDRNAKPYEVFDGRKLVPVRDYSRAHPLSLTVIRQNLRTESSERRR
jgi:hypothetical protein